MKILRNLSTYHLLRLKKMKECYLPLYCTVAPRYESTKEPINPAAPPTTMIGHCDGYEDEPFIVMRHIKVT